MSESLFTSQTPSSGNNNDGSAPGITTATSLTFATAGTVSAIRFYATSTVVGGETYLAELWSCTTDTAGTRLASQSASGAGIVAASWNTITFGSPVAVSTGTLYRAAINNSAGRYVATSNFFTSTGLTTGNLTAIQDGTNPVGFTAANGVFADGTAGNTFPASHFNAACYFVDVVFDVPGTAQPTKPVVVSFAAQRSTSW